MSKKLDLAKYKRMARILEIIMKFFAGVGIFATIVTLLTGICLIFTPDTNSFFSIVNNDSFNMNLAGSFSFKVNPSTTAPSEIKVLLISIMFMAAAISATLTPIFHQLGSVLGTIKDDRPFAPENAKRLTVIGVALMIGSVVTRFAEFFVAGTIVDKLKLADVKVTMSADSNMILMGFIVIILAGVFKYGSYLQQQYDSTV